MNEWVEMRWVEQEWGVERVRHGGKETINETIKETVKETINKTIEETIEEAELAPNGDSSETETCGEEGKPRQPGVLAGGCLCKPASWQTPLPSALWSSLLFAEFPES